MTPIDVYCFPTSNVRDTSVYKASQGGDIRIEILVVPGRLPLGKSLHIHLGDSTTAPSGR